MSPTGHAPAPRATPAEGPNRPEAALSGDYVCAACGYRISSFGALPRCPMCGTVEWSLAAWRPFSLRIRAVASGEPGR